jgi:hypothetical protein
MMFNKLFLASIALAAGVYAQTGTETASAEVPTSTDGIPACVLDCTEPAATSAGCSGL